MTDFASSQDGREFIDSGCERQTSQSLLYAVAIIADSLAEAERIWRSGTLPDRTPRASAETIYETARRNMPTAIDRSLWHGDASWLSRVAGWGAANHAAGRRFDIARRTIFDAFGLRLIRTGGMLVAEHASPTPGLTAPLWTFVSEEQGALAIRGEAATRALLVELTLARTLPDDTKFADTVKIVRDRLMDDGDDVSSYAVTSISTSASAYAITMQQFDGDGRPRGAEQDFSVDNDAQGTVKPTGQAFSYLVSRVI